MVNNLKMANIDKDNYRRIVNKYDYLIRFVCNNGVSNLSDEKYYYLLNNIYDIKLNDYDMLEILSDVYSKEYDRFVVIDTPMVICDWERELFEDPLKLQVVYDAFISKKVDISMLKYMQYFLSKMFSGDIVVAREYKKRIHEKLDEEYEYIDFKKLFSYDSVVDNQFIVGIDDRLFSNEINYLRSVLDERQILEDLRFIINDLSNKLIELDNIKSDYYARVKKLFDSFVLR